MYAYSNDIWLYETALNQCKLCIHGKIETNSTIGLEDEVVFCKSGWMSNFIALSLVMLFRNRGL